MHGDRGFSLIELLIVVAIILVIAAIALPNLLQARMSANEASAVGSLNALRRAEAAYVASFPDVGYSPDIASLGGTAPCTVTSGTACLIDTSLSAAIPGSSGKSGYVFLATGLRSGGATINTAYVVGASPTIVHSTGNRDFCSTSDGVLRSQYANTGDVPVNALATCTAFPIAQ
jgi:type IV pilus assembly protein PilA